ncbi:MAG TPA: OmpA family protein [Terriglobales bacterium]|nr:OmpA family protein [Terriglobales bacterium]
MSYCANCGSQLHEGENFCPGCGTAVREGPAAAGGGHKPVTPSAHAPMADPPVQTPQSSSDASLEKLAALNTQSPPPASSSGKKILVTVLVIVLLGGAAVVGGGLYIAYKIKQKASAALNKMEGNSRDSSGANSSKATSDGPAKNDGGSDGDKSKDNPLGSVLDKLQGGDQTTPTGNIATGILEDLGVKNPSMPKDLVRNIPYSAIQTPLPCPTGAELDPEKLANASIHFKPGTILTSSWSLPKGDAEGDDIIQSVSPAALGFKFDGIIASHIDMSDAKHTKMDNTVCSKDLLNGEAFATGWQFHELKAPGLYPGLSRLLLPAQKFSDLKSTGSLSFVFGWYEYMDTLTEWELLAWKGTLTRIEPEDVPFPLIIDDQRVNVPTIHVKGQMKVLETAGEFGTRDQPVEAYILDDPNAPMVLNWIFGKDLKQDDAFQVRYIRVRYGDKPTIAQQLAKQRKAITYGINFDYNSAAITPVSEPVLKEIAQAMADKPDWKLTISGHTDNIGGHAYNLALSQRRSAAVKQALVERYHVNPNRLSTSGSGDYNPVDTNDTLEGRARNRRVELTLD